MFTELRYTLVRFRWQILGWGLGIAVLGLIIVAFYDAFLEQQETFLDMVESYPPELLAFFGGDAASLATTEGYLGMYGFSMLPVIAGIFAVIAGSGLIASDEEGGQLDLILAHPFSRTAFFLGRLLALFIAVVMVLILGWLGFAVLLGGSPLDVTWYEMALPFLPLLAQTLIYCTLALVLSMLLPARRLAAMGAGLVMVASYFLTSMSSLNEGLESIAAFLPYAYFQGSDALNGLNWGWLVGLSAVSVLLSLVAWWRFSRRDIRVAGEGRWAVGLRRITPTAS
jgi:ABC-2 type transport system permease protein